MISGSSFSVSRSIVVSLGVLALLVGCERTVPPAQTMAEYEAAAETAAKEKLAKLSEQERLRLEQYVVTVWDHGSRNEEINSMPRPGLLLTSWNPAVLAAYGDRIGRCMRGADKDVARVMYTCDKDADFLVERLAKPLCEEIEKFGLCAVYLPPNSASEPFDNASQLRVLKAREMRGGKYAPAPKSNGRSMGDLEMADDLPVLLRNDRKLLPLDPKTTKKVLVVGNFEGGVGTNGIEVVKLPLGSTDGEIAAVKADATLVFAETGKETITGNAVAIVRDPKVADEIKADTILYFPKMGKLETQVLERMLVARVGYGPSGHLVAATARFPFGHGLGNVALKYEPMELSTNRIVNACSCESSCKCKVDPLCECNNCKCGCTIAVTISISNDGEYNASDVVQLYKSKAGAVVSEANPRRLCGFTKVFVKKGKRVTTTVPIHFSQFPGLGKYRLEVGSSMTDIHGEVEIEVLSAEQTPLQGS